MRIYRTRNFQDDTEVTQKTAYISPILEARKHTAFLLRKLNNRICFLRRPCKRLVDDNYKMYTSATRSTYIRTPLTMFPSLQSLLSK
jgi:hypothetical protein